MLWTRKDEVEWAGLDRHSCVHDHYPIGDGLHDRQVVRHEQESHVVDLLALPQEFKYPSLDCHVERGCRLISQQELRSSRECERDHDALTHASRKLVRVRSPDSGRIYQVNRIEELVGPGADGSFGVERANRLFKLATDANDRIER